MFLPRYKLELGTCLKYRMSEDTAAQEQPDGERIDSPFVVNWDFYPVARHADGTSHVLFSESRTQHVGSASVERRPRTFANEGYFDLSDDGRLIENRTITPLANPAVIFPQLPSEETQLSSGWHSTMKLDSTKRSYSALDPSPPENSPSWRFAENCQTQLDSIYAASRRREYTFDLDRGLIAGVSTNFQRAWPAGMSHTGSDVIDLIETIDSAHSDPRALAVEAARYFDACAEYQRLIDLALWDAPQTNFYLLQAGDTLAAFEATARSEPIQSWARRKLQLHDDERAGLVADADQLLCTLDKPAPDWQAVDLHGKRHHLIDYRDRALVLCFWNRGCTWSIRALVALNNLAVEMQALPVAFLGIGADRDAESAAFVWQTLDITFPTVLDFDNGRTISSNFGIDSFPTTVVIDQDGNTRRIRAGFSYELTSTLALELNRMIARRPTVSCDSQKPIRYQSR